VAFEAMPFHVLALEMDAVRAKRIHENLARLKLRATVKVADAGKLVSWWDGESFDAVLLDAPCTASGIVRRHPDVRWLRRAGDAAAMAEVQLALLGKLWPTVALGGRLLYATCSVFEAEGADVVRRFVDQTQALQGAKGVLGAKQGATLAGGLKWLDSQGLWLPCAQHDGFYDALFEKNPC
jgi:16S rRNA (cytosine967-C5)-methyltransferase